MNPIQVQHAKLCSIFVLVALVLTGSIPLLLYKYHQQDPVAATSTTSTNASNISSSSVATKRSLFGSSHFLIQTTDATSSSKPKSLSPKTKLQCVSFDNQLNQILNTTSQIFIGMPDKAAGTSFAEFTTKYCMKNYNFPPTTNNYLKDQETISYIATHNYDFPPVISSHIENDSALMRLVKESTDETVIVYIHRQETDRLLSSIKEVAENLCTGRGAELYPILKPFASQIEKSPTTNDGSNSNHDNNVCIFPEKTLLDIINTKVAEIGKGAVKAFQCDTYQTIENHKPRNMIVLNYKQADKLQEAIAKRYCPDIVENNQLPIHSNVGLRHGSMALNVRLESVKSQVVTLDEWLIKKKHVLEMLYDWYNDYDCHGKMRDIEEVMFNYCDDEMVQLIVKKDFFVAN